MARSADRESGEVMKGILQSITGSVWKEGRTGAPEKKTVD